jgi:hypothetical protein
MIITFSNQVNIEFSFLKIENQLFNCPECKINLDFDAINHWNDMHLSFSKFQELSIYKPSDRIQTLCCQEEVHRDMSFQYSQYSIKKEVSAEVHCPLCK